MVSSLSLCTRGPVCPSWQQALWNSHSPIFLQSACGCRGPALASCSSPALYATWVPESEPAIAPDSRSSNFVQCDLYARQHARICYLIHYILCHVFYQKPPCLTTQKHGETLWEGELWVLFSIFFQDCRCRTPCLALRGSQSALTKLVADGALCVVPLARASFSHCWGPSQEKTQWGDSVKTWDIRPYPAGLVHGLAWRALWSGPHIGSYSPPFLALLWASFKVLLWVKGQRKTRNAKTISV